MNVIQILKKIGEKIISVVEFPLKEANKVEAIFAEVQQLAPGTKSAFVGLAEQLEALGPDLTEALAAKGLDLSEDLKAAGDVKALFTFVKDTFWPQIQTDFDALSASAKTPPAAIVSSAGTGSAAQSAIIDKAED